MKALLAVICLLVGATFVSAEMTTTKSTIPAKPATPTRPATPVAPVKPGAKDKVKVEAEAEPVIPGVTITRENGTFLGLEVVSGKFKLSFYDAKKKPMSADVTRAAVRWPNPRAPGDNRNMLNLDGTALVGNRPVIPPYTFTVFLTLLQGDGDESKAVESFAVPFHG